MMQTQLARKEDVGDIGEYSVASKPQVAVVPVEEPSLEGPDAVSESYAVVVKNDYPDDEVRDKVAARLGIVFRKEPRRFAPLLKKPDQVVKKNMTHADAFRMQQIFEMAGADSEMVPMLAVLKVVPEVVEEAAPEVKNRVLHEVKEEAAPEVERRPLIFVPDEEDSDDLPGDFNLKDKLSSPEGGAGGLKTGGGQLEVIKSIDDTVVDLQFVTRGQKYQTDFESGRLRLAQFTRDSQGYVLLPETWNGTLFSESEASDLGAFKTDAYLHDKRKGLYRIPLSCGDTVVAADGYCEYRVRHALCAASPQVGATAKSRAVTWRHWGLSGGFHLLVLLAACIIFAITSRVPEEETLHFVKIDMSQFQEALEAAEVPEETPEAPPAVPPPVQEVAPAEPEPAIPQETPEKQPEKTEAETPRATPEVAGGSKDAATNSRSDAGGGFGEGNILNRNINQTGLLSLLGETPDAGSTASSAGTMIAEVTNLDAVEVPGASDNQFSVGGIKGSLGNGKLSVASGEAVRTKGGKQVLRSAGVEGPGTVAALERGEIGNKQVKGMVTAQMSKTVSIQGGMSREMVKRVIDQHLEEIQYCYESALLENPAIMGRIVYEWKILLSGNVGEINIVSSTVNSHIIHDCIKDAIKSWKFPKPTGSEVVVSYPFVFDLVGF